MKLLLSINQKFHQLTPFDLIKMVEENGKNIIDGFEIQFKLPDHCNYVMELADLCVKYNYHLQIHASTTNDLELERKYLEFCDHLAQKLNYKIKVTYHSVYCNTLEGSIKQTSYYMAELLHIISKNNYNVEVCLENLNSVDGISRINTNQLSTIFNNNQDLKFTYDVGHSIIEYEDIKLEDVLIERLKNIHIHTFVNGEDHYQLLKKDPHKQEWVKAILYLKKTKYNETVTLEYDVLRFEGDTLEEKVINYIESAKFIKQYL